MTSHSSLCPKLNSCSIHPTSPHPRNMAPLLMALSLWLTCHSSVLQPRNLGVIWTNSSIYPFPHIWSNLNSVSLFIKYDSKLLIYLHHHYYHQSNRSKHHFLLGLAITYLLVLLHLAWPLPSMLQTKWSVTYESDGNTLLFKRLHCFPFPIG